MNKNLKVLLKNISYSLSSNLISLLASSLVVLVIPKLIGVEEYGLWQLYLFYSLYVGFLHFGWNDGIYLRYGGEVYENLNKKTFFSQFWLLLILQAIIGLIAYFFINYITDNFDKIFILKMTIICMLILNTRYMLFFILQATNKIKEYAKITILDRVMYLGVILIVIIFGYRDYKLLIGVDLLAKFSGLVYSVYLCKDIVLHNKWSFSVGIREMIINIKAGSKLMFANIASKLMLGVVRFGIEFTWSVVVFGKISLILSMSNFLMTFINATGLVIFPLLRRAEESKLPYYYATLRNFLMSLLLGVLIFYYPVKVILSLWLPKYEDSFKYIGILLPICVFESKMSLLVNTYFKALRKEKLIAQINFVTFVLSVLVTIVTTFFLKNLDMAVFSITFLFAVRSVVSEIYLSRILKVSLLRDVLLELIIIFIFIALSWFINTYVIVFLYSLVYMCYLIIKRNDLRTSYSVIKSYM